MIPEYLQNLQRLCADEAKRRAAHSRHRMASERARAWEKRRLSAAAKELRMAKRELAKAERKMASVQAWAEERRKLAKKKPNAFCIPVRGGIGNVRYPSIAAAAATQGISPATVSGWVEAGIWKKA